MEINLYSINQLKKMFHVKHTKNVSRETFYRLIEEKVI